MIFFRRLFFGCYPSHGDRIKELVQGRLYLRCLECGDRIEVLKKEQDGAIARGGRDLMVPTRELDKLGSV